jgi:hypothetical protein
MRKQNRAIAATLAVAASLVILDSHAVPIESIWGLESSTSAKKSGKPVPELDGYSDVDRLVESAGANAETQGIYREELKSEPVCYDPTRPERMPWYLERTYETITTTILDVSMTVGGSISAGELIALQADFKSGTVQAVPPSCGHNLQLVGPSFPIDFDTVCAADVVLDVRLESTSRWISGGDPDDSYDHNVGQLPSCTNALIGYFNVWDTTPGCDNNTWGIGQLWTLRLKAVKTELVDTTPNAECFYP